MVCMKASDGPYFSLSSHTIMVLHPTSEVETAAPYTKNATQTAATLLPKLTAAKHTADASVAAPTSRLPQPWS